MDKKTREDKVRKEVWAGRKRGGARGQPQGGRYDPWFRIPKFDFAFLPNLDFPCHYKGSTTPSVCFVGMGVGMVRGGAGTRTPLLWQLFISLQLTDEMTKDSPNRT